MRRGGRWIGRFAITLALLLALASLGAWWRLWRALPVVSGRVVVQGLAAPVEILRDAQGVPHVRAASEADAYFGLGYVHAQDRLWQMEFQRRIGHGRLSEVLGPEALPTDRWFRTLGFGRLAAEQWSRVDGDERLVVEAYARGVNAVIDAHRGTRLPVEFALLGFVPEPWRPEDSLVWVKVMSLGLDTNFRDELLRARIIARHGADAAAALMPEYTTGGPLILPEGIAPASPPPASATSSPDRTGAASLTLEVSRIASRLAPRVTFPIATDAMHLGGSNNWVVSGARTATGRPILANDPHLGASLPGVWYVAHVQGGLLDVIGATLPGTPAFPIGHNRRIAWGLTNLMADVQDLYVERLGDDQTAEFRGTWEPMRLVHETIRVKDSPDEHLLVRTTRHGPLVSDVLPGSGNALALRWSALDPDDRAVASYRGLSLAGNWDQFTLAAAGLRSPMLNFVYADVDGNIGYFAPGALPARVSGHDGTLPVPGWSGDHEWQGYVPAEHLPRIYNPSRGFVASANNKAIGDGYPYRIGTNWEPGYRAARITALLEESVPATVERFAQMQTDLRTPQVRVLLPWMQRAHAAGDESRAALERLRRWDGALAAESGDAALFMAWVDEATEGLFADELGPELWADWAALPHWRAKALDGIVARSDDGWCDDVRTGERETCETLLGDALQAALDGLQERQGADPRGWQWGRDNEIAFRHEPFDAVRLLRPFFSRRVAGGGNGTTVSPVMRLGTRLVVASYRQVIDLADFDRSRFVYPLGQSGQLASRHYADFLDPWLRGGHLPLTYSRNAVDAVSVERLTLTPR